MPRNNILGVFTFRLNLFDRCCVILHTGISQISKIDSFNTFYQAATVEYFFLLKPDYDVVLRMAMSGKIGLKSILTDCKYCISVNQELCPFHASFLTEFIGLSGCIGWDLLLFIIGKSAGSVFVKMSRDTQDNLFMVSFIDTIQQRLKLRCIPGSIEQDDSFFGDEVHTIRRYPGALVKTIGRVDVEIAG